MAAEYLHNHREFQNLISKLEEETGILATLIEKDYWIMHVLFGLQQMGLGFELKGGTSLSKGFQIIDRFSEDIDIHIKPPSRLGINENPKNHNTKNADARKKFYDWLADTIKIDGIDSIVRDYAFDDPLYYRSGGIRLQYSSQRTTIAGIKEGILLEAGFDTVTPNQKITISSWAYDRAVKVQSLNLIDNRAIDVLCYDPGYTLVEKLQTIATKFRKEQTESKASSNFMRQYYDVYCLLAHAHVINFIGSKAYLRHKQVRFPKQDLVVPIHEQEAFLLSDPITRNEYRKRYQSTAALYYKGQPGFEEILERIHSFFPKL